MEVELCVGKSDPNRVIAWSKRYEWQFRIRAEKRHGVSPARHLCSASQRPTVGRFPDMTMPPARRLYWLILVWWRPPVPRKVLIYDKHRSEGRISLASLLPANRRVLDSDTPTNIKRHERMNVLVQTYGQALHRLERH